MARETIVKGPNYVHPEKPSAVGSRNSLNRHNRDEYQEARGVIDEEVDKILNHIHAKLPPEVLEKLDVMGSMKSKLHNYFNQDFQNMLNRYLVTMEDEMGKKVRDLVDKEENRTLNRYTAREITEILDRIGGTGTFNTGEIEKSLVNMYSHLQGHIERGMSELESNTNALLREKSDVGAFVRGQNSYAIVKCSFKDNGRRPKTVMDVKLSIGILDSELVSRIYHYQVPVTAIIKDIVAKNIHELIDREIEEINHQILDEGREEMTDAERIFEKLRIMDKYISDDDSSDSKRYQFVAKKFLDAVDGIQAEIDSKDYDALNIRENIKKIIDKENIRNRGFNTAVNAITSILDTSKMGYQYIENFKNARDCLIREYEEEDPSRLPDERYSIRLTYYDQAQLKALRKAYSDQIDELNREVMHLWNVCDGLYVIDRNEKGYDDWNTLSEKMLTAKVKKGIFSVKKEQTDEIDDYDKSWNEISFIAPKETIVEKENPTDETRLEEIGNRFPVMLKKLEDVYQDVKDERRRVLEARIDFLKAQFDEFNNKINPYHVQPGLLLDIDIVSIKKKKTTMMNMANVINEFLFSVSKGFSDAAFVSLARTRSTERADIEQEFISVVE
jgi:hypothetical protein